MPRNATDYAKQQKYTEGSPYKINESTTEKNMLRSPAVNVI
jgi:hypothetical protein